MTRRTLAILLLILAMGVLIATPILAFTPVGASLLGSLGLAQDAPTPTATPVPVFPTPLPPPKPTPILTVAGKPPPVTAHAIYVLDLDTNHTLIDINGEQELPMASTTKIMTALIVIQTANLDAVVTIGQDAFDESALHDGSNANLVVGDKIKLRDLLYGLLVPSGDDAAIALADALGGTSKFVQMMNRFAARLHLFQTHYNNPDGLTYLTANGQPDPNLYTTAYDLTRLARYAMSIPLFAQIVKTQEYTLAASADHHAYHWVTTNTLLSTYAGTTGVKTGYTAEAGGCLVFSAMRAGHHLLGVILNSIDKDHRFSDAQALLNWSFGLPLKLPS